MPNNYQVGQYNLFNQTTISSLYIYIHINLLAHIRVVSWQKANTLRAFDYILKYFTINIVKLVFEACSLNEEQGMNVNTDIIDYLRKN